eukprot:jgi/Bigna1/127807/aug1.5_g2515
MSLEDTQSINGRKELPSPASTSDSITEFWEESSSSNMLALTEHDKFFEIEEGGSTVQDWLTDLKQHNPRTIPYCFYHSKKLHMAMEVGFIPGTRRVMKEFVKGFRYRHKDHRSVRALINYFKKHASRPPPEVQRKIQTARANNAAGGSHRQAVKREADRTTRGSSSSSRGVKSESSSRQQRGGGGDRGRTTRYQPGMQVRAFFAQDGQWYPAKIIGQGRQPGTFAVEYQGFPGEYHDLREQDLT